MNVYDTLSQNPMTIYNKGDIKVIRCGELIFFYKQNDLMFKSLQPNKVNSNLIMKIVDKILIK